MPYQPLEKNGEKPLRTMKKKQMSTTTLGQDLFVQHCYAAIHPSSTTATSPHNRWDQLINKVKMTWERKALLLQTLQKTYTPTKNKSRRAAKNLKLGITKKTKKTKKKNRKRKRC